MRWCHGCSRRFGTWASAGATVSRLAGRARANGIHRFHARLFSFNHGMLALFERLGEMRVDRHADAELDIDVELPTADDDCLKEALRAAAEGHVGLRR